MADRYDVNKFSKFSRVLSTEEYKAEDWIKQQVKAFTLWCNTHLTKYRMNIENVENDFQDGIKLYILICHLAEKPVEKYDTNPKHKLSKISNLCKCFDVLTKQSVKIVNISCEDIYDKNLKLILGLIWTLIQHYQIGHLKIELGENFKGKMTDREVIKAHLVSKLSLPADKKIDFHQDFQDGILLCGLVNSVAKHTVQNWSTLDPSNKVENVTLAMDVAEEYLAVPKMMEVEDVVEAKYDDKVFMTYLSTIMLSKPIKTATVSQSAILHEKTSVPKATVITYTEEVKCFEQESIITQETEIFDKPTIIKQKKIIDEPCDLITQREKSEIIEQVCPPAESFLMEEKIEPKSVESSSTSECPESSESLAEQKIEFMETKDVPQDFRQTIEGLPTVTVIDFNEEDTKEIYKASWGCLLLDDNLCQFNPQDELELKLYKIDDQGRECLVASLDLALYEMGIAEATFNDIPEGTYQGIITCNRTMVYQLSKKLIITEKYKPRVRTIDLNKQIYENMPISFLFDVSDYYHAQDISIAVEGPCEKNPVFLQYSEHLTYLTFIPKHDGCYCLTYTVNGSLHNNSTYNFEVKACEKDSPSRPFPILYTPYENNTFEYYFTPYILSWRKTYRYKEKFELDPSDSIVAQLILSDNTQFACDASYYSSEKFLLRFTDLKKGLYILKVEIVDENHKSIFLNCRSIIVEENTLHLGVKTSLCFNDYDGLLDMQSFTIEKPRGVKINAKKKQVNKNKFSCKKITFVPLTLGKIIASFGNSQNNVIYTHKFEVTDLKDCAIADQKYTKSIKLPNIGYKTKKFEISLTNSKFEDQKYKYKLIDDKLCVSFVPTKSGIYLLKVKYNGVYLDNSPFKIFCKVNSNKVCGQKYKEILKLNGVEEFKDIVVNLVRGDGVTIAQLPYTVKRTDKNTMTVKVIWSAKDEGYYKFDVLYDHKSLPISHHGFYVQKEPKYSCYLYEPSTITIPCEIFQNSSPPKKLVTKAKIFGPTGYHKEEVKLHFKPNKNEKTISMSYTPIDCGIMEVDPKISGTKLFACPVKILARNSPYKRVTVSNRHHEIKSKSSKIFIKLREIERFEFYDDNRIEGLVAQLSGPNYPSFTTDLCVEQNNHLGIYLPKDFVSGKYKLALKQNDESQDLVSIMLRIVECDTEGNLTGEFTECPKLSQLENLLLINLSEKRDRYEISIKDNKLKLDRPLKYCGLYKIVGSYLNTFIVKYVGLFPRSIKSSVKVLLMGTKDQRGVLNDSEYIINDSDGNKYKATKTEISPAQVIVESRLLAFRDYLMGVYHNSSKVAEFKISADPVINPSDDNPIIKDISDDKIEATIDLNSNLHGCSLDKLRSQTSVITLLEMTPTFIKTDIVRVQKNKAVVSFKPTQPGEYSLGICEANPTGIVTAKLSTVYVKSDSATVDGRFCAIGNGLKLATVDKRSTFRIFGQNIEELKKIKISSDSPELFFKWDIRGEKCIRYTYIPKFCGIIDLRVKLDKKSILRSPYTVNIVSSSNQPMIENTSYVAKKEIILFVNSNLQAMLPELVYSLEDGENKPINSEIRVNYYDAKIDKTNISVFFYAKSHGLYKLTLRNNKNSQVIDDGVKLFYVNPWSFVRSQTMVIGSSLDQAVVGKFNSFKILENAEYENGEYSIKFEGPEACLIDIHRITYQEVDVKWKPSLEGEYWISIVHKTKGNIEGFPKKVIVKSVSDFEKDTLPGSTFCTSGHGLVDALLNYPNTFQIICSSSSVPDVEISIKGKEELSYKKDVWKYMDKSIIAVTYSPPEPGRYTISLSHKRRPLKGSPYILNVNDRYSSFGRIACTLEENFIAKCNKYNEFFVDASNIQIWDIDVKICSLDKKYIIKPVIRDTGNNIFSVQFKISLRGDYSISVLNRGFNIPGSPYIIKCI